MEAVEYQRFIEDMVAWAVGEPTVIGLIAVGSTAALTHDPDEWSDLTARLAGLRRDTTLRAAENDTPLDNLDPYRRIGVGHPEICRRLNTALAAPLPELAETMLLLLEEHLVDRVPAFSAESLAAVRAVAARL